MDVIREINIFASKGMQQQYNHIQKYKESHPFFYPCHIIFLYLHYYVKEFCQVQQKTASFQKIKQTCLNFNFLKRSYFQQHSGESHKEQFKTRKKLLKNIQLIYKYPNQTGDYAILKNTPSGFTTSKINFYLDHFYFSFFSFFTYHLLYICKEV